MSAEKTQVCTSWPTNWANLKVTHSSRSIRTGRDTRTHQQHADEKQRGSQAQGELKRSGRQLGRWREGKSTSEAPKKSKQTLQHSWNHKIQTAGRWKSLQWKISLITWKICFHVWGSSCAWFSVCWVRIIYLYFLCSAEPPPPHRGTKPRCVSWIRAGSCSFSDRYVHVCERKFELFELHTHTHSWSRRWLQKQLQAVVSDNVQASPGSSLRVVWIAVTFHRSPGTKSSWVPLSI